MEKDHVNLGTGQCISISDTAEIIKNITGFEGPLILIHNILMAPLEKRWMC